MRYSYEYKRKCVELYREGKWADTPNGVNEDSFHQTVRDWVKLEDKHGPEALKHKSVNKNWTPEEKLKLVCQVTAGKSIRQVAIEAGVNNGLLYAWVRKYKEMGYNGLVNKKKGRPGKKPAMKKKISPKPLTESEREELIRLKERVAYLEAENAVIKKEIALREEKWAAQAKAKKQQRSKNLKKKDTH